MVKSRKSVREGRKDSGSPEEILSTRWKQVKTEIYNLIKPYSRDELLRELFKVRETFTRNPRLSNMLYFSGIDVVIHLILNWWPWKQGEQPEYSDIDMDIQVIAGYGKELVLIHALQKSIQHGLFTTNGGELVETKRGETLFRRVSSFEIGVSGTNIDLVRMQWKQKRTRKSGFKRLKERFFTTPPSVIELHHKNAQLMFLRSSLPFYGSAQLLSPEQKKLFSEFVEKYLDKLKEKVKQKEEMGEEARFTLLQTVRIKPTSKFKEIFEVLNQESETLKNAKSPCHVSFLRQEGNARSEGNKYMFGPLSLDMFKRFLDSFEKESLDDKARLAEEAVSEIIENSGWWEVVEKGKEVIHHSEEDNEGHVVTEIDVIARSKQDKDTFLLVEVKDYSFWSGWLFGGSERKKSHYEIAAEKMIIKEESIKKEYHAKQVIPVFVSSVIEPFEQIANIPIVFIEDLELFLEKLSKKGSDVHISAINKHQLPSNFLLAYYKVLRRNKRQLYEINKRLHELHEKKRKIITKQQKVQSELDTINESRKILLSEIKTFLTKKDILKRRRWSAEESEIDKYRAQIKEVDKKIKGLHSKLKAIDRQRDEVMKVFNKFEEELNKINREISQQLKRKERYSVPLSET